MAKTYMEFQAEALSRGISPTAQIAKVTNKTKEAATNIAKEANSSINDIVNQLSNVGNAMAQAQLQSANANLAAQQASAQRAMEHSSKEAQLNREWQEMMSNTAYQRAMKDMKAAGLNPILAYQQGGASTPGGSSAGGYTINGAQGQINGYAAALQTAPALFNAIQQIATSGYNRAKNSATELREVGDTLGDAFQMAKFVVKQMSTPTTEALKRVIGK